MKLEYQINVNGFVERISVDKKDIDQFFLTIIKHLIELSMKKKEGFIASLPQVQVEEKPLCLCL